MPNRLTTETSPYLRQHAENPVEWYPWGPEAFADARATDRPILLSIGYAACHWCHVMAHESFEDPATAAVMNELFVNVKVDREERPDVDRIYMEAVQAMTGRGGWPMTVFLTPDGDPFYGGTYFPPRDAHGMPSFTRLMRSVSTAWLTKRDAVRATTATLRELYANASAPLTRSGEVTTASLNSAAALMLRMYDADCHGFGGAPKFPHAMALDFLLRHGTRHGDDATLRIVTDSWLAMAHGGIYDQLGGGFARYATDREWVVPHFEKMLYDNALLATLGVHLAQSTGSAEIERITKQTLAWVLREMTGPEGGMYASIDADSEGEEGTFYVWTRDDLRRVLGDQSPFAELLYGVTGSGNFEGRTVLTAASPIEIVAARRGITVSDADAQREACRAALFAERATRIPPATDHKRIASWNGLMLIAFAEAARVFGDAALISAAERLGEFLTTEMVVGDRVARTWMDGVRKQPGFLEDQAAVAAGMLALYQTTGREVWLQHARALTAAMLRDFWDADAHSFFDTASGHETLITRPRDLTDNATPSGSSLACNVLLQLATLDNRAEYRAIVDEVLAGIAGPMSEHPLGFGLWLSVADRAVHGAVEVAVVGDDERTAALHEAIRQTYVPTLVVARASGSGDAPALATDRAPINDRGTAYVCRGYACDAPTTDPATLSHQLRSAVRYSSP
jgi:uncharacterized protein